MTIKLSRSLGCWLVAAGVSAGACAEERAPLEQQPAPPPADLAPLVAPVSTTEHEPAVTPFTASSRTGSAVQLASVAGQQLALVLDEDAHALRLVDTGTLTERAHLALAGNPSQLVVAGDGRAYVSLRDKNQVVAVETDAALALTQVAAFEVAAEPVAVATDPKGELVVVSSAWGAKLAGYDVKTHARRFEAALPREPRGVTISSDGQVAHVAHAVGSVISRVALTSAAVTEIALGGSDFTPMPIRRGCFFGRFPPPPPRPTQSPVVAMFRSGLGSHNIFERDAVQGFAVATLQDRVFVPEVLAHRGEVAVGGYGGTSESFPVHQPVMAVVEGDETWLRVPHQAIEASKSRYGFAGGARRDACLLPRAAASDETSQSVLVSCLGTNEVQVLDADKRAGLAQGTRARFKVPAGPTGIAVDSEQRRAFVWSQFARTLSVIGLPEPVVPVEPAAAEPPRNIFRLPEQRVPDKTLVLGALPGEKPLLSALATKGRALFVGAGDHRISADGRACASCHPDGREDGLTWPTPFGARQTPMLAGRLSSTAKPFGWQGDAETVAAHLQQTFKRLGGTGLRGEDLEALVAYCTEMATPPALPVADEELVAEGKQLFFAETVGCGTCHKDGAGSDGNRHEVGSGPKLDTPSLRFIAGTAPYFHDGRYATLAELLEHSQGQMGWANGMTKRNLQALEAYLLTL